MESTANLKPEWGGPFSSVRAEHLGDALATLFVPIANVPRFGSKPVLVEGGRGSGKTMLFRYNSFDSKWREHWNEQTQKSDILAKEDFLGFYYKTDDTVVPSMAGRSQTEDRWRDAFSSYLAYRLLREMYRAVARFVDSGLAIQTSTMELAASLVQHTGKDDWHALAETARKRLYEVLEFANRPSDYNFRSLPLESAVRDFVDALRSNREFADKKFLFFIDEVENLNELQQHAAVTLLINSEHPVFYNLGCKVGGLVSQESLLHQSASELHDFERSHLNFNPNESTYQALVREIFRKRIQQYEASNGWPQGSVEDDARKWLGDWNVELEAAHLAEKRNGEPPYAKTLRKVLADKGLQDTDLEDAVSRFTSHPNEIINRMHLVLLEQGNPPAELLHQLDLFLKGDPSKYRDWIHNYRNGVLFLLSREYGRARRYYGFETLCLLSNGNVRVFIELCHYAFTAAKGNNLDLRKFRPLTPAEQDTSARLIAEAYVRDIRQSRGCSNQLYFFVLALGKTFKVLHYSPRQSEPEPNHFSVVEQDIGDELRGLLRQAVMHSVLSEAWATKVKDPDSVDARREYILNRVYAPYFGISYRKNRSLPLTTKDLAGLLKGNKDETTNAAHQILGRYKGVSPGDFDGHEPAQVSLTKYEA